MKASFKWKRQSGVLCAALLAASGIVVGCGSSSSAASSSSGSTGNSGNSSSSNTSSSSSGASNTSSSSSSSSGVVQLTYWNMWSGKWESVVKNMVNDFNKTHPHIHVNVLSIPSATADQKFLTAVAAGSPPDVFTEWNPDIGAFAAKNAVMNLNQFMTGKYSGLKSWFYPAVTKFSTYKGNLYAMPWTINTYALYYNKTIMKQAGISSPPKTISEFWTDQSKEWKFGSGNVVKQIGFYPSTKGTTSFEHLMPAFGVTSKDLFSGGKYHLTGANALADLSWVAKFSKYPYSQVSAFSSGLNAAAGGSSDAFDLGKAGFWISGMWEMGQVKLDNPGMKYGVVPIPATSGGFKNATWINGNYNLIPKGAKHPKQAFEFISWLSGYNNAAWAAKSYPIGGWVPNSPQITKQPAYQKWMNQSPLRQEFVNVLKNPNDVVSPVTPASMFYGTKLTNAENYVLQKKKTPKQALANVETKSNNDLG